MSRWINPDQTPKKFLWHFHWHFRNLSHTNFFSKLFSHIIRDQPTCTNTVKTADLFFRQNWENLYNWRCEIGRYDIHIRVQDWNEVKLRHVFHISMVFVCQVCVCTHDLIVIRMRKRDGTPRWRAAHDPTAVNTVTLCQVRVHAGLLRNHL